jgi:hypothetical protein
MQIWKVRLSVALAMLAMVLAVSVSAIAQDDLEACDFDEDEYISEEEADACADAIEDVLGLDANVYCADDDDGDGSSDEDGDDDGEDDDEDGSIDEDDDCEEYVIAVEAED